MKLDDFRMYIVPSGNSRKKLSRLRVEMSVVQAKKAKELHDCGKLPDREKIISLVNEYLVALKIGEVKNPEVSVRKGVDRRIKYSKIWENIKNSEGRNKRDIVWLKFTRNGVVEVVGTSCDIFFDEERSSTEKLMNELRERLNDKTDEWYKGLETDDKEVLIFPLRNIPNELGRADIESGIGNYLISKGVPILNYFSHNL